jgi:hypothetical protein
MANVYAVKSGNWSDPTVWNTGELPTEADDVWSNTFTVTIDVSPTVLSIRNGAASGISAGGSFTATNGIVLTCTSEGVVASTSFSFFVSNLIVGQSCTINGNVIGGNVNSSRCIVNNSSGTIEIFGNVSGGSQANNYGIINLSVGTINVFGSVNGGTGNSADGIRNNSTGIINITGNVTAGGGSLGHGIQGLGGTINITGNCFGGTGSNTHAILYSGTGIVNITGNVNGGGASGSVGIFNASSGTINITGNATGGSTVNTFGAVNQSTGTLNITGDVIGGSFSTGNGVVNASSGTMTHIGPVFASTASPGIGIGSVSQITTLTGPLISTEGTDTLAVASGVNPCIAARWFVADTALGTFSYTMRGETVSGSPSSRLPRVLALPEGYNASYPLASDVRSPVTFGPDGVYSGTMIIPPTESVIFGVPVDDTTGTATPEINADEVWNFPVDQITTPGSIGERVAQLATVASVGDQIAAMKQASD